MAGLPFTVTTAKWELAVNPPLDKAVLCALEGDEVIAIDLDRDELSQLQWQLSQAGSALYKPTPGGPVMPEPF